MSFYLGLGKRRNESYMCNCTRDVLNCYTDNFLDKNMYMFLGLTITFYSLWSVDPVTTAGCGYMVWSTPLVIVICMRYSMIVEGGSDGDPVEVLFRDKTLVLLGFIYALIVFIAVYWPCLQEILK